MSKGTLIVIEGTDGSGKETQAKLLTKSLERRGLEVTLLSFPCYGTPACAPTEMYLRGEFGKNPGDVSPYAASVTYAIDRYASFKTRWENTYNKGGIFIADRYTTSNAVHQASKLPPEERKAFLDWLYDIEYVKMGIPVPDLVIYLDIPPEGTLKALSARSGKPGVQHDIHETNGEFLTKSRENALEIARHSGWLVVKAGDENGFFTRKTIHAKIMKHVNPILELKECVK